MNPADARAATLALLAARAPEATVCPSEVARAIAAGDTQGAIATWRDAMPVVHDAVDGLVTDGLVRLSWRGKRLSARAGPYRIARDTRTR
ncbi:DUF3253 domain-containing protein [Sphingomonas sp. GC_Shp_3]|uniref:DUF3253 domain-containing protein n=1 Tax=Sphingomonas sp. GC_Shp_3 TaxID=2937383 RepID=UPI002269D8B7